MVKDKKERYERYGYTCSETNLNTLPPSAPEEVKLLAKWLTLDGRKKSLVEWLGSVQDDGRIHGKFWPIGAWTHRMAHTAPNQANIASPFHGTPVTAVEEIKAKYDSTMRGLWKATEGKVLVGTDADSAQLRILAHYTKSEVWKERLMTGDKKLGTDAHTMNKGVLGPVCKDRDVAKTFVYAWILNSGIARMAQILSCNNKQATEANKSFESRFPELMKFKRHSVPMLASTGFFTGVDGRQVPCNSEHLMLAGLLQNGEAVVMKHWTREWRTRAKKEGLWFRQVNFVHDEVQVEVNSMEDAARLIALQSECMDYVSTDLGLFCPFKTESKTGYSWLETH